MPESIIENITQKTEKGFWNAKDRNEERDIKMKKISNDKIAGILRDIADDRMTIRQIADKWGVSSQTVQKIKKERVPVCPKCGNALPAGSKFCNLCGAKILTEKEQVAENLKKAAGLCAGCINADEIRQAIFAAVKFLEDK